jgi:uncharacterized surface protein with fasciclin (FAS1) repeats
MNKKIAVLTFCIAAMTATFAVAGSDPMVGGHEMLPSKNIIQNAMNSDDHTTLVAAVKAASLVDTLQGPGPSRCSLPPTRPSPSCRRAQWKPC